MKKNLIVVLLLIALVLLGLGGYKYLQEQKGDIDLPNPMDEIKDVVDEVAEVVTGAIDEVIDENVLTGDIVDSMTGTVLTGSDVVDEPVVDKVEDIVEPKKSTQPAQVNVEDTVDTDFDPKEFEDQEINELMDLLKEMLGE